jgi:hypothetical protein
MIFRTCLVKKLGSCVFVKIILKNYLKLIFLDFLDLILKIKKYYFNILLNKKYFKNNN